MWCGDGSTSNPENSAGNHGLVFTWIHVYFPGAFAHPMTPQATRAPLLPVVEDKGCVVFPRSSTSAWTTIVRPITELLPESVMKRSWRISHKGIWSTILRRHQMRCPGYQHECCQGHQDAVLHYRGLHVSCRTGWNVLLRLYTHLCYHQIHEHEIHDPLVSILCTSIKSEKDKYQTFHLNGDFRWCRWWRLRKSYDTVNIISF